MLLSVVLLEVGIIALSFGMVMARRGYVTAYKSFYPTSITRLLWGAALILIGFGVLMAAVFVP